MAIGQAQVEWEQRTMDRIREEVRRVAQGAEEQRFGSHEVMLNALFLLGDSTARPATEAGRAKVLTVTAMLVHALELGEAGR